MLQLSRYLLQLHLSAIHTCRVVTFQSKGQSLIQQHQFLDTAHPKELLQNTNQKKFRYRRPR